MSDLLIAEFRLELSMDLPAFGGTLPTTGECIVRLVRVFQSGRVSLRVEESLGTWSRPERRTVLEVPIDVEISAL